MITSPLVKTILCYGDSNTWGVIPNGQKQRYPINIRWPGVLQNKLGSGFSIIEEGLPGRTTALNDEDSPERNGLIYLTPCIASHNPLDYCILMLGSNDLKSKYNQTSLDICLNTEKLIHEIRAAAENNGFLVPKVILVAPVPLNMSVVSVQKRFANAEEKRADLIKKLTTFTQKSNLIFFDTSNIHPSKIDGLHLDEAGHSILADELYKLILGLRI